MEAIYGSGEMRTEVVIMLSGYIIAVWVIV